MLSRNFYDSILGLDYCAGITDDSAEHIAKMKGLTSLLVSGCKIGDLFINAIVSLKLKSLDLSGLEQITDDRMTQISKMITLESLHISDCPKLTDKAAIELAKLINLSSLYIGGTSMTDKTIETLASSLINLTELDMSKCPVKNLKNISKLTNLRKVDFGACNLNDQAWEELLKLKDLTRSPSR